MHGGFNIGPQDRKDFREERDACVGILEQEKFTFDEEQHQRKRFVY